MPRTEFMDPDNRKADVKVTERFTHKMVTPEGLTMRADGQGLWLYKGCTMLGDPPPGWDWEKAELAPLTIEYDIEREHYN